jgi:hypothetical protein
VGDLDGDGDPDVVISNSNDLAEVYLNASTAAGGWLRLELRSSGGAGGTAALGSKVSLVAADRRQQRELRSASSYLSQSAAGAHFGLGGAAWTAVDIRWPDGRRQRLETVPASRRLIVGRRR